MGKNSQYNPEWNKKRQQIGLSFTHDQYDKLKEKYGDKVRADDLREILLTGEFKIISVHDNSAKEELIFQLKKIGNNLNQIAWKLNSNYDIDPERLKVLMQEVQAMLKKVNEN